MSRWLAHCGRVYRRVGRAFPHHFKMICGDGLEQLGDDMVTLVWRERGLVGLVQLFGDLALHLPLEYLSAWSCTLKELTMTGDPFEGTWRANNKKSQWDPASTPEEACLRLEATDAGYLMVAYGIKDGKAVAERPQSIIADGRRRPLVDLNGRPIPGVPPGALAFGSRPDPQTIEAGAEVDGKTLRKGIFRVSNDGKTLTVTTAGIGPNGPFKVAAVFERVVPDPYVPQA